ncbi:MAG: C45 family autoproteolytic acyltransferase/hydrolase [Sciscionella sp.]
MSATIVEKNLHGLRWLVVEGHRDEVFRALGAATAEDIRAVLDTMPEAAGLRRYAATAQGRAAVEGVLARTRASHARELRELRDLAAGAGVDPELVLLANLRGDLGGDDGVGCSDLAYRGTRSLLAHNEDGAPALDGRFLLLTVAIAGEVPVTVQWYPGFLPSNTFVATGHGLVWGINHVQIPAPAMAAGRHFVARRVQQQPNLDGVVRYLTEHPSAGGFTYTVGELRTGRVVTIEAAAGRCATVTADPSTRPLLWHTNHLRLLETEPTTGRADGKGTGARGLGLREESEARGRVLASLLPPDDGPDTGWLLDVLAHKAMPDGVYRSATGDDPLMTLCTTVVDLTARMITLRPRGGGTVTLGAAEFASGGAHLE